MNPPSRRGQIVRLIAFAFALLLAAAFVDRAINPSHINKLVLLFRNPDDRRLPQSIELNGLTRWEQPVSMTGALGPKRGMTVNVADIHGAWFDGTVTLKDTRGAVIAAVPIAPRGRYGGTLVILVGADGTSTAAWNEIPDEEPRDRISTSPSG